ncbi:MAG: hypothetical protein RSC76_09625 [Oscillospiraceae bacterium]
MNKLVTEGLYMRKKLVSVLLICALLVVSLPTVVVKAEEVELTAPSGVLMEAASGKVLFEKASREKRACASITKVMTLLLAMEAIETGFTVERANDLACSIDIFQLIPSPEVLAFMAAWNWRMMLAKLAGSFGSPAAAAS